MMIAPETRENGHKNIPISVAEVRGTNRAREKGVAPPPLEYLRRFDSPAQIAAEREGALRGVFLRSRLNEVRYLNKFMEMVNSRLRKGGYMAFHLETAERRKQRILGKYPGGLNWIIYAFDYLFCRVCPKLPYIKKLYFGLTGGRNRVISETEVYGRLYSCGFRLLEARMIEGQLLVMARKTGEPDFNMHPTYGPFIRLRRYGRNNRVIKVLKLRTMHPYSEYLQEYFFEHNGLQSGGKFKDDPRVTTLGHYFRRYWIDELPMLYNLLRGDVKIVGVRPLSEQYFHLYPEAFRVFRQRFKPGLVPPYCVDLPQTLEEIVESERRYLEAYQRNPLRTDIRYFFLACRNILMNKVRSS